jgi:hypothetical protein
MKGTRSTESLTRAKIISLSLLVLTAGGLTALVAFAGDAPSHSPDGTTISIPDSSAEPSEAGWLEGLELSGELVETFGMWQNPSALRDFTPSRNNLAVARSQLQVDENYSLNDNNSFFMREWFVYEPPYSFNSANNTAYAEDSKLVNGGAGPASFGHFLNGFYNRYDVRDAWWKTRLGPLTVYTGNQIVVWGQSLAFRVGDVVNPQDTTWGFGFANLEQSRTPLWMVHPILDLPDVGLFTSNSLEALIIPRYQPQWTSVDFADGRYDGEEDIAGSVSTGFPAASHGPSARFDAHYPNAFYPGRTAILPGFSIHGPFGPEGAGLVGSPISNEFFWCSNLLEFIPQPFNPVPKRLQRPCNLTLRDGTVNFGPTGSGAIVDIGQWKIPAATVSNWEEGVRLHSLIGASEVTSFYLNTWNAYPSIFWQPFTNQWRFKYMPATFIGTTWDRPLPIPPGLAEFLPLTSRAEVVYANHQPFMSFDVLHDPSGVSYSDTVDTLVSLDLDQAYAPWLSDTGSLTAFLELQDYITVDANHNLVTAGSPYGGVGGDEESVNKNEVNFLAFASSSWWWEAFRPSFAGIYNPKGTTFLLFPGITLTPPWTHKYFMTLEALEILGGDNMSIGGGLLKGQSLLLASFQYNFDLL